MAQPTRKVTTRTVTKWSGTPNPNPVYPRIHVKYISTETLKYYALPWEYDTDDSNYIIIKREISKYETDILFEHTKRIRAEKPQLLLTGPPKEDKKYAWYRKRARSSSRIRKAGILQL